MKATVLIPTKNGGTVFQRVLASVLAQVTPWPFEVIVIDSGSVDGTVQFCKLHPEVRLVTIDPFDFGHGKTRNLGVGMANGEFVAVITQDALPANVKWLIELVTAIEQDPEIAGVFGRHVAYPDASPFTANELEVHFSGFDSWRIAHLADESRYAQDEGYRQVLHFFSDNNAMIRRSVWEIIPYPDVDFAEDQIWAQKIIEAGYKKAYARDAVVVHSHDYGLFERLQRSFDEAHAFQRLFGYVLCRGPGSLVRSWLALTSRDLKFAWKKRLFASHGKALLLMPFDNLMRLLGYYLGARGNSVPKWMRLRLSRDKQLMAKLQVPGDKADKKWP